MSLLRDYLTISKEDSKGKCKAFKSIENILKIFKIYFRDKVSGFFWLIFSCYSQSPLKMYLKQNLICLSHFVGNIIFVAHQIMMKLWSRNTCFLEGRTYSIFHGFWCSPLPCVSQRTQVSHAGGHLDAFPSQQCGLTMYSWGMHLWTPEKRSDGGFAARGSFYSASSGICKFPPLCLDRIKSFLSLSISSLTRDV